MTLEALANFKPERRKTWDFDETKRRSGRILLKIKRSGALSRETNGKHAQAKKLQDAMKLFEEMAVTEEGKKPKLTKKSKVLRKKLKFAPKAKQKLLTADGRRRILNNNTKYCPEWLPEAIANDRGMRYS